MKAVPLVQNSGCTKDEKLDSCLVEQKAPMMADMKVDWKVILMVNR